MHGRRTLGTFLAPPGVAIVLVVGVGCSGDGPAASPAAPPAAPTSSQALVVPPSAEASPSTPPSSSAPEVVPIPYRVERRTSDAATADFEAVVDATLVDARGWRRAGFRFDKRPDAPYVVVLAEGPEVDALCLPYQTRSTYSCQNGPVVALNAERWRSATPQWTGDLATYRQMLVNHEVGHLVGQHHPEVHCPAPGQPAPIMAQQSTELDGCLPNPWPLPHEIERAGRHDLKIAPGYGE